jgi:hypothetical protein
VASCCSSPWWWNLWGRDACLRSLVLYPLQCCIIASWSSRTLGMASASPAPFEPNMFLGGKGRAGLSAPICQPAAGHLCNASREPRIQPVIDIVFIEKFACGRMTQLHNLCYAWCNHLHEFSFFRGNGTRACASSTSHTGEVKCFNRQQGIHRLI